MPEQNCVFAYDDYFCRECVGKDVPFGEIIPLNVFDEVPAYPVCAACGKVHNYMILTESEDRLITESEDLPVMEGQRQAILRLEAAIDRLCALLVQHAAALERQTDVMSRPNVLG